MVSNQFHSSEDRAYRVLDKLKLNFKSILRTADNYFLMFSLSPSYSKERIPMDFSSSAPSSNHLVGKRLRKKGINALALKVLLPNIFATSDLPDFHKFPIP